MVGTSTANQTQVGQQVAAKACGVDAASGFSCRVLASAEDTWGPIMKAEGVQFAPAGLIFYSGNGQSGCGAAQSAMGPFYCPTDNRIYLDTEFFGELDQRFHAAGDFAQAYVVAHEYGHHIQFLTGIAGKVRQQQEQSSSTQSNALQVRMELQADCYAGVWANKNSARLDPGDVQEGLRAAQAIGDDTLQKETQGTVVPDSFTHGTSAQRMEWLKRGIDSGDPRNATRSRRARTRDTGRWRHFRQPARAGRCIVGEGSLEGRSGGCGAVAQMGERCNRTAEVRGSIPLSSTSPAAAHPTGTPPACRPRLRETSYAYRHIGRRAGDEARGGNLGAPKADGRNRGQADHLAHHEDLLGLRHQRLHRLPRLQGLCPQGIFR